MCMNFKMTLFYIVDKSVNSYLSHGLFSLFEYQSTNMNSHLTTHDKHMQSLIYVLIPILVVYYCV